MFDTVSQSLQAAIIFQHLIGRDDLSDSEIGLAANRLMQGLAQEKRPLSSPDRQLPTALILRALSGHLVKMSSDAVKMFANTFERILVTENSRLDSMYMAVSLSRQTALLLLEAADQFV